MPEKKRINNFSAVTIIYPLSDPSQIFMEMKDGGYPRKVFAGKGLIIGGNWIGDAAQDDINPRATAIREINEELSFDSPIQNYHELNTLFGEKRTEEYFVQKNEKWKPTPEQTAILQTLKRRITTGLSFFGDYEQTVPEKVFQSKEPGYNKGDYYGHASVFVVGLSEDDWNKLVELQKAAGNLSNESVTIVTSLGKIIESGLQIAWGQDQVLKDFFSSHKLNVDEFPMLPGVTAGQVRTEPFDTYDDYLEIYDPGKRP